MIYIKNQIADETPQRTSGCTREIKALKRKQLHRALTLLRRQYKYFREACEDNDGHGRVWYCAEKSAVIGTMYILDLISDYGYKIIREIDRKITDEIEAGRDPGIRYEEE